MSIALVHRPTRVTRPVRTDAPVELEAPPLLPDRKASGGGFQSILPVGGAMLSMLVMMLFRGSSLAAVGAVAMVVTLIATAVLVFSQQGKAARNRRQQRERYLDYLEEMRERLGEQEGQLRRGALAADPAPRALWDVIRDPARLWERRRRDSDFLLVRLATGLLPGRAIDLRDEATALTPADPFMLAEAQSLVQRFSRTPQLPLRVPLDSVGDVSVIGSRADVLAVVRALLLQVTALHAPEDVGLALVHQPDRAADWDWARWLPHTVDNALPGADGPVRRIAPDPDALAELIGSDLRQRTTKAAEARRNFGVRSTASTAQRLLVVHDSYGETAWPLPVGDRAVAVADLGLSVLHLLDDRLHEPDDVGVRITVDGDQVRVEDLRAEVPRSLTGSMDDVPAALAEGLARVLAPLRLSADSYDDGSGTAPADFTSLLGIDDPIRLDLTRLWAPRGERDFLRVPLGVDDRGRPVLLDLKEAAQLGMGPHGLCVGATGSGKSEMLRTLVLSLLTSHPPERLSMILVDYKGGATFAPFEGLPHVAGVITNLSDDASLVERMHSSLAGEVRRRQQVLKNAGSIANITDYEAARTQRRGTGDELPALPHLLVIIDEFGELLTAKPDFIELFLSIGRIGRSIGVHLLLSSQRIESGKLKGLDTYLSYRLGMRTFSESESRTVLDTTDAFYLPPLPGFGYLKVDTTIYERFKSAYVAGPLVDPGAEVDAEDRPTARVIPRYGQLERAGADEDDPTGDRPLPARPSGPTLMSLVLEQLAGAAAPVPQIWLPPLPAAVTLDHVGGGLNIEAGGVRLAGRPRRLQIPLGLRDDPADQWQGRLDLDLTRAGGHVVVVGGPQSGKTTLLRTLVLGAALTHTPGELAVYAVDLLGGAMGPVEGLPHVGGAAGRADREKVRRTLQEVRAMIDLRERVFREQGIDSLEELRRRHDAGELPEIAAADVLLVVDGYGRLTQEFEELEPVMQDLLARGGGYGVHVVVSVGRANDVRMAQQPAFGNRIELRLSDAADSQLDRKLAATIRADQPGRALTRGGLLAQVALPRLDGDPEPSTTTVGLNRAVRAVAAAWAGPAAPPVRVLPGRMSVRELPDRRELAAAVPIGVEESSLAPVVLDLFGDDRHLLALGDSGSGKTTLLRVVARGLVERFTADELVLAVFDPRRRLRDWVPEAYLGGYAPSAPLATALSASIASELARRTPEDPMSPVAPSLRIVLLVDDYDVLAAAGGQPLAPLTPYLASAGDLGLHVVMTRRVAGAARGLYEPFTMGIRESGATGLVLAGDRSEGQLFTGVRAGPQPPGRGVLVRAGQPAGTCQLAWVDAEDDADRPAGERDRTLTGAEDHL